MKIYFLPRTKTGRWSVVLIALWPLLTILGSVIVNMLYSGIEAGNGIINDLRMRPLLAVTMLLGIVLGAISFPMSLVSIFKKGERSVLSILTALLGLFLIILIVGELFVEH